MPAEVETKHFKCSTDHVSTLRRADLLQIAQARWSLVLSLSRHGAAPISRRLRLRGGDCTFSQPSRYAVSRNPSLQGPTAAPDEVLLTLSTTLSAVISLPQDFSAASYLTRLLLTQSTTLSAVISLPQDFSVARYHTRLSLTLSTTFLAVFSLLRDCHSHASSLALTKHCAVRNHHAAHRKRNETYCCVDSQVAL